MDSFNIMILYCNLPPIKTIFNVKDNNEFGYDFESNGFKIRCIYADLFKTFLTYKIERVYFNIIDTSDQAMAINSITPVFQRLNTSKIIITSEKLEYLKQKRVTPCKE